MNRQKSKIIAFGLIWVFIQAVVGAQTYPVSVENCGRTLTFEQAPERIITTFQSVAEPVVALGDAEKIVGLYFGQVQDLPKGMADAFADIPTLGEGGFPSREVVLAAEPDLVIAYGLETDFGGDRSNVREALEAEGVNIFGINCDAAPVNNVAAYLERLTELGLVLGREAEARDLSSELTTRLAELSDKVSGLKAVEAVFYYGGEGPFTVYGSGFANEIITLAGGVNLFADQAENFPTISAEVIAASNPEALFWADFGPIGAAYLPDEPLQFLFDTFASTDAASGKQGGGFTAAGLYPSIRMAESAESLARLMHPEAFE